MAYDKVAVQEVGAKLWDLIDALTDGVDAGDIAQGTAFLIAASGQAGTIGGDPDAAVADILSGLTSAFADSKRDDLADPVPV